MILTLCGSARFEQIFHAANEVLSFAGHTVFTLTVFPSQKKGNKDWYTEAQKRRLDAVHKKKIKASDAIVVLNRLGYIGESTMSEIDHAEALDKKVYFLESWGAGICTTAHRSVKQTKIPYNYCSPIDTFAQPPYRLEMISLFDHILAQDPVRKSVAYFFDNLRKLT